MSSGILDDPGHENRMSFDDLEQVYKNISRRNILNKVSDLSIIQLFIKSTTHKIYYIKLLHFFKHSICDQFKQTREKKENCWLEFK